MTSKVASPVAFAIRALTFVQTVSDFTAAKNSFPSYVSSLAMAIYGSFPAYDTAAVISPPSLMMR